MVLAFLSLPVAVGFGPGPLLHAGHPRVWLENERRRLPEPMVGLCLNRAVASC